MMSRIATAFLLILIKDYEHNMGSLARQLPTPALILLYEWSQEHDWNANLALQEELRFRMDHPWRKFIFFF